MEEIQRIALKICGKWKNTQIIVRGDAGFCRDFLMSWCEDNGVDFILGMSKNPRLLKRVEKQLRRIQVEHERTGVRRFKSFMFRIKKSWSRKRRVVCKAKHFGKGTNLRFVVTSLGNDQYGVKTFYENIYCARGDGEPYQGPTTSVILRRHLDSLDTIESVEDVLLGVYLCTDGVSETKRF